MNGRLDDETFAPSQRGLGVASVTLLPISRPTAQAARLAYLDNLKVALVVGVIVVHAANFYYGTVRWPGNPGTTLSYGGASASP